MSSNRPKGCLPIYPDPRDRKFQRLAFGAVAPITSLPKTLGRKRLHAKDQDGSLACTAHAVTGAAEYQDGIELSAAYTWSQECKKMGNYIPNGADPRTAMKVGIEIGFIPEKKAPYHFPEDNYQVIGNWTNWPDALTTVAEPQKKAAYVPIQRNGDWFDSVRAALVRGFDTAQTVMAFVRWRASFDNGASLPSVETNDIIGGHAIQIIDFDTINGVEYLIVRNSYGKNFADNGYQYMPRETANRLFSEWGSGAYVYVDLTAEDIQAAKEESPVGALWRTVLQIWAVIMIKYGNFARGIKESTYRAV